MNEKLTRSEQRRRKERREAHLRFCRWYLDNFPAGKLAKDIGRELDELDGQQSFLSAAR